MEFKWKDRCMQICRKKKPIDDSEEGNSNDGESDAEELEACDGFVSTISESQVRAITPKLANNDSFNIGRTKCCAKYYYNLIFNAHIKLNIQLTLNNIRIQ